MKKYINPITIVHEHLFAERHCWGHRMSAGMVVMALGVGLSKACVGIHFMYIDFFGEMFGYGIHAVGASPALEWLIKKVN